MPGTTKGMASGWLLLNCRGVPGCTVRKNEAVSPSTPPGWETGGVAAKGASYSYPAQGIPVSFLSAHDGLMKGDDGEPSASNMCMSYLFIPPHLHPTMLSLTTAGAIVHPRTCLLTERWKIKTCEMELDGLLSRSRGLSSSFGGELVGRGHENPRDICCFLVLTFLIIPH